MALPTAQDVFDFLSGYGIDASEISPDWIDQRITNWMIPWVEMYMGRYPVSGIEENTEFVSGTGSSIIFLSSRNAKEIVSIEYVGNWTGSTVPLDSVELIPEEGIIKMKSAWVEGNFSYSFPKGDRNIKVTYKIGGSDIQPDIKEAIIMLTSEVALGHIGARTGGGALSVEGFSRNYGGRGKWQDIRNDLKRQAVAILKRYTTAVV